MPAITRSKRYQNGHFIYAYFSLDCLFQLKFDSRYKMTKLRSLCAKSDIQALKYR